MATEDSGMATEDSGKKKLPAEPVDIDEGEEKAAKEILNRHVPQEPTSLTAILHKSYDDTAAIDWRNLSPDSANGFVELVHAMPYLPQQLKSDIVDAKNAYNDAHQEVNKTQTQPVETSRNDADSDDLAVLLENLTAEKVNLVQMAPDKKGQLSLAKYFFNEAKKEALAAKKEALAAKKEALAAKKEALAAKKDKLLKVLRNMEDCARHIKCTLDQCASMTQAEKQIDTGHTATCKAENNFVKKHVDNTSALAGGFSLTNELYQKKMCLDHLEYLPNRTDSATGESYESLERVYKAWTDWVLNSSIVSPKSKGQKECISDGVAWMREKMKKGAAPNSPGEVTLFFPNLVSEEVNGTQTAFCGLLDCISDARKAEPPKNNFSPNNVDANQEQILAATETRRRRKVDVAVGKPGAFMLIMFDHFVKLIFELKSLFRKHGSIDSQNHESFEQILASLAKSVFDGFNKFGVGTPTKATAVTGTLAYITIYELKLSMKAAELEDTIDAGSDFAKLQLLESKKLPLMTKGALESWFSKYVELNLQPFEKNLEELQDMQAAGKENKEKKSLHDKIKQAKENIKKEKQKIEVKRKQLEKLKSELFGADGKSGVDKKGIPFGIRIIWELMAKRREELFGPDYKKLLGSSVGECLGTGAFGIVFSAEDNGNAVWKVPLLPSAVPFKNDIKMLRQLQRDARQGNFNDSMLPLPVLRHYRQLKLTIGGIEKPVSALLLEPKGRPILSYLGETNSKLDSLLDTVSKDMKGALDYIHGKDVCYNDMSPKNIIAVIDSASVRFCLVDFGSASLLNESLEGFVGTLLYAHESIFSMYPGKSWKPRKEYDLFSLGLTMAALLDKGNAGWTMPRPKSNGNVCAAAKDRCEIAKDRVSRSDCHSQKTWLQWIALENTKKTEGNTRKRMAMENTKKTEGNTKKRKASSR